MCLSLPRMTSISLCISVEPLPFHAPRCAISEILGLVPIFRSLHSQCLHCPCPSIFFGVRLQWLLLSGTALLVSSLLNFRSLPRISMEFSSNVPAQGRRSLCIATFRKSACHSRNGTYAPAQYYFSGHPIAFLVSFSSAFSSESQEPHFLKH